MDVSSQRPSSNVARNPVSGRLCYASRMKTWNWDPVSELDGDAWRTRLQEYCDMGDRDVEPVFVGREDVFAKAIDPPLRKVRSGRFGSLTVAIGGAPGAGKSAIVAEGIRRYRKSGLAVPIELKPSKMGPAALVQALAEELELSLHEEVQQTGATSAAAKLPFLDIGSSLSEATVKPAVIAIAEREGGVPWLTIRDVFKKVIGERPILLFVDEAQSFKNTETADDHIPRELHHGAGPKDVPIIPVYTGLADTGSVLHNEAGLTRSVETNTHALGGLPRIDAQAYVRGTSLDYLGLIGSGKQVMALHAWMVEHGDGWPQHLRSQMAALAQCMLDANSRNLADLDLNSLREHVAERRDRFYAERANGVYGGDYGASMLAVLDHTAHAGLEGTGRPELIGVAREALGKEQECAAEPRRFVEDMIHSGMLQQTPHNNRYHTPIPSMHKWLRQGRHLPPALDINCGRLS